MSEGSPAPETLAVRCCIVGGGPAGMMLGLLLARAGVEVLVLEKHADFFRDFRGDTIHPSTLEVVHELGLLEDFLTRPHQELRLLRGWVGDEMIPVADFSHLPTRCKFIALMPQWDFLDFLTQHARKYPNFRLRMQAEVTGLIEEGGRVAGVRAQTPAGALEVRADLVVGADGRHSTVREKAGLQTIDLGAPMDVLWMRLSQRPGDPKESMGRFDPGHVFVMIDRGDYWQCAFVIPKGGFADVKARGLDAFRAEVARLAPFLRDRVGEIADWDHVKLLTVAVNRVREWYRPGLLCIGDAAHAMSPIGGIGINLAVQDAVAAGNILAQPLRRGPAAVDRLRAVQRRRELPTRITQRAQVFIQSRVIGRVLTTQAKSFSMPLPLRLLRACPFLRRIPARLVGLGVQPEHVNKYLREAT
jgi:2-polyprenyl-6-methoxyphenol hydroxylase-like FAD-dependent oxidoreductase